MDKLIIIKESDLKSLIQEAVTNAVDGVTKKIASRAAVMSYNNQIFGEQRRRDGYLSCGAGDSGGCGSSSSRSSGGCGGGYESGGC